MSEEFFPELDKEKIEYDKREQELKNKYRLLFSGSDIDVSVLADILCNFCHFGSHLESPEQVAAHNVGVFIMGRLGVFNEGNQKNLIAHLLNAIPIKEE